MKDDKTLTSTTKKGILNSFIDFFVVGGGGGGVGAVWWSRGDGKSTSLEFNF